MKLKTWEIILWKDDGSAEFKRELLGEVNEIRAREEARKRYAVNGWSIYNVSQVKVAEVE